MAEEVGAGGLHGGEEKEVADLWDFSHLHADKDGNESPTGQRSSSAMGSGGGVEAMVEVRGVVVGKLRLWLVEKSMPGGRELDGSLYGPVWAGCMVILGT